MATAKMHGPQPRFPSDMTIVYRRRRALLRRMLAALEGGTETLPRICLSDTRSLELSSSRTALAQQYDVPRSLDSISTRTVEIEAALGDPPGARTTIPNKRRPHRLLHNINHPPGDVVNCERRKVSLGTPGHEGK